MKKYVIMATAIGIGGWQLYTDARIKHLNDIGVQPFLLYADVDRSTDIQLPNIMKCEKSNVVELSEMPAVYTGSQFKRIIKKVLSFLSYSTQDEVFIESTNICFATWGEEIAKATGGINYAYILQSHTGRLNQELYNFFKMKYDHKLLSGMSEQTIPEMFEGYCEVTDHRSLVASWNSPLTDCRQDSKMVDIIIESKERGTKVIGYFGSLDKPHFVKLCSELNNYFDKRVDKKFIFISIGSSANGNAEAEQMRIQAECENCRTINFKSRAPVSKELFSVMDICIGSWGSATISASAGVPTIRLIDDVNVVPQGIIGYTLLKKPYSQCPVGKESLEELLDNVLFKKVYPEFLYPEADDDALTGHAIIDKTMKPFMQVPKSDYFDIKKLGYGNRREKLLSLFHAFFGSTFIFYSRMKARKIKHKK